MEWISINDRLPEKGMDCLVFTTSGCQQIARYTDRNSTYGYNYKEKWFRKGSRQLSKKTITHWMPLPEPPKAN